MAEKWEGEFRVSEMALWVKAPAAKTGSQSRIPEMVEAKMTPLKLISTHGPWPVSNKCEDNKKNTVHARVVACLHDNLALEGWKTPGKPKASTSPSRIPIKCSFFYHTPSQRCHQLSMFEPKPHVSL